MDLPLIHEVPWSTFKSFVDARNLSIQWLEIGNNYWLKAIDGSFDLECRLWKNAEDQTEVQDFENNYKDDGNIVLEIKAADGRPITRADSRPRGYTTTFISRGDSLTNIGDGKIMEWDFSNSADDISAPSGFKRKRLEVGFSDKIYIKEGTLYFHSAPKGCYVDFYVVCKTGGIYEDPNGTIPGSAIGLDPSKMYTQATADTKVTHYVNYHHLQGDCPMGDELNTEGASEAGLPTQQQKYVLWIELTTPDTDSTSNGYLELEIYRMRTLLLPGEDL